MQTPLILRLKPFQNGALTEAARAHITKLPCRVDQMRFEVGQDHAFTGWRVYGQEVDTWFIPPDAPNIIERAIDAYTH